MAIPRQLPNAITIVRIFCAPVFLWMLLADGGADGPSGGGPPSCSSSRSRPTASTAISHASTRSSRISESSSTPSPTRCSPGFAFIGLSILGELPWWVTVVVLIREIGITVYRFMVVSDHVLAAAWMGKLKTMAQALALSLALLPLWTLVGEWIWWVNGITMTVAVVLTIASGIDYIVSEVRASRAPEGRASA